MSECQINNNNVEAAQKYLKPDQYLQLKMVEASNDGLIMCHQVGIYIPSKVI